MNYPKISYLIILFLVFTNIIAYIGFVAKTKELNKSEATNRLLQEQVNNLEEEKKNGYKPHVSMTYTDSGHYKKVLALNECNLYALPIQDYIILRPIEANTAVPVLDTVISSDNNIWLYVEVLALDTPMNYKGWIRESDIVRLTEENRYQARNVSVKEGMPVYEGYLVEHIKADEPEILGTETFGMIREIHEEWVNLAVGGGSNFWVNKKDINYPEID